MKNVNVKKNTTKINAHKSRRQGMNLQTAAACEGIQEFMLRLALEQRVKISNEPVRPKYRHD
ncbi:MAG: hypothetical protein ABIR24_01970 [Verrucomicrobiota bacterium]